MSVTHTGVGLAVFIGFGTLLVDFIAPKPPVIVVHDLHYEDGLIYQDRTVTPDGDADVFYAFWAAKIVDGQTGEVVCSGDGAWPYAAGRRNIPIPLSEWVGEPCDLPPGQYRPIAAWSWGYDSTDHAGRMFTIEEAEG